MNKLQRIQLVTTSEEPATACIDYLVQIMAYKETNTPETKNMNTAAASSFLAFLHQLLFADTYVDKLTSIPP